MVMSFSNRWISPEEGATIIDNYAQGGNRRCLSTCCIVHSGYRIVVEVGPGGSLLSSFQPVSIGYLLLWYIGLTIGLYLPSDAYIP